MLAYVQAQVGNPDKKQRWLYAANVTAVRDMTPDALNSQPPNTTPSPYAPPTPQATGFLKGSNLSMSMGTGANAIGSGGGAASPAGLSATICHVGTQFTCFPSTKVQNLTQKAVQPTCPTR